MPAARNDRQFPRTRYHSPRQPVADGSGTAASPYRVTTVVTSTDQRSSLLDLQLTEVDTLRRRQQLLRRTSRSRTPAPVRSRSAATLYHAPTASCGLRHRLRRVRAEPGIAPITAPAHRTCSAIRRRRSRSSCRSPPATPGTQTTVPGIWSDSTPATSTTTDLTAEATVRQRRGDRVDSVASPRAILTDVLVPHQDRRHGPRRRLLVHRQPRHRSAAPSPRSPTRTRAPPRARIRPRSTGATARPRRERSAGGNGNFTVAGSHAYATRRHVPGRGHDHIGRHQPGQLDRQRLGDDHRDAGVRSHRPPSVSRDRRRVLRFGESGRPADDGVLPVRARPEVHRRRPGRLHPVDPGADRGLGLHEPPVSASVSGLVPNALYHVRLVATNSAGTTFGPDITFTTRKSPAPGLADARQDVQHLARQRRGAGQGPRRVHPADRAHADPQEHGDQRAARHADADHRRRRPAPPTTPPPRARSTRPRPRRARSAARSSRSARPRAAPTRASPRWRSSRTRSRARPATPPARQHKAADATAAAASSKTLQLLHASAKGKFRTRAATAPPPSAAPSGRSPTAATAPSPTTSPTRSRSPTSSATRRSSSTPVRAIWPRHPNRNEVRMLKIHVTRRSSGSSSGSPPSTGLRRRAGARASPGARLAESARRREQLHRAGDSECPTTGGRA